MTCERVLLAILADRPYWMSTLEILGAPPGVSFYRGFSYRQQWVSDDLLAKMSEGQGSYTRPAIIGMRFRDDSQEEATNRFIPIRHATATLFRNGEVTASLVLGEYIRIDDGNVDFHALEIQQAVRTKLDEPILARCSTTQEDALIAGWGTGVRKPDYRIWSKLATSELLPSEVRDRFRDQVVLYCTGLTNMKTGQVLKPETLQEKGRLGPLKGYRLRVGQTYGVGLEMRRVGDPGQVAFPEAPDFEFISDPDSFAVPTNIVPFTGNYREISIWVRSKLRQPAPIDLWWHPREAPQPSEGLRAANVGLRVPVNARPSFPVVYTLAAVVLLVLGVVALVIAATRHIDDRNAVTAFVAVGTLLTSAGTAVLWRALDNWARQG